MHHPAGLRRDAIGSVRSVAANDGRAWIYWNAAGMRGDSKMSDETAAPGTIFVCGVCGKTSPTRYGLDTRGWDASCMMHAVLCTESTLKREEDGKVTWADAVK